MLSRVIIAFLFSFLAGCSSVGYQQSLVPQPENGWKVTGEKSDLIVLLGNWKDVTNKGFSASYQCDKASIDVDQIAGHFFGLVGPPVVPLIPVWGKGSRTVEVHIDEKDPWEGGCPTLVATFPSNTEFLLRTKRVEPASTKYHCSYDITDNESNLKELRLSFKFRKCETDFLIFEHTNEFNYCMFCPVPIGG